MMADAGLVVLDGTAPLEQSVAALVLEREAR